MLSPRMPAKQGLAWTSQALWGCLLSSHGAWFRQVAPLAKALVHYTG